MPAACDIEPDLGRIQSLIDFARGEGWHVGRTTGGQLKFTKSGCASIYIRSSSSDAREKRKDRGALRRAAGNAPLKSPDSSTTKGSERSKEARRA
jgi:hypothetical protein